MTLKLLVLPLLVMEGGRSFLVLPSFPGSQLQVYGEICCWGPVTKSGHEMYKGCTQHQLTVGRDEVSVGDMSSPFISSSYVK